ncbi:flagellar basal body L-ring protein FlgH [Candidatus Poribacteria bacterium]|nr:flagellar basal body L-ring protein FlgH [Candidatus Poribacteria bacterium]
MKKIIFIFFISIFFVTQINAESLWKFDDASSSFFGDQQSRARKVGDTLTVEIAESAVAKREGQTSGSKESSVKAEVGSWQFGKPLAKEKLPQFGVSSSASHQGGGSISSSDNIVAKVSAMVVKVMDNGNLVIEGRRSLVVNNDCQIIIITGIVRPQYITANNTILSTYIAEAEIRYENKGLLADKQNPGWITKFFDWIWIF